MTEAYLLLGSNLGDRDTYLASAIQALFPTAGRLIIASSIYETAAWGNEDQQAFLNQVLKIETPHSPFSLLAVIHKVETALGRVRQVKWEPRPIDIDILYYGDMVLTSEGLTIPHPHLQERRFTLAPLVELAPGFIHPKLKLTNQELLLQCTDPLPVQKL